MKSTLLFYLFFSLSICCFAQMNSVTGTIYDEDKNILADANVIVKNSKEGTITDKKGQFTLDVTPKDTLEISYLGFETKEIVVGDQKEITIILKSEWEKLDASIIVAEDYNRTIRCGFSWKVIYIEEEYNHVIIGTLFPNPSTNGLFQLQLDKTYTNIQIEVFNMNGQLIQTSTYTKLSKIPQIDLSTQAKGVYLIRTIVDGELLETKKAVKA
ncbi:TonB-dependent receptor SusC [Kordia antarctica]|uniref:TonB-dependent receptor SusC n=1 Tax=Kordia antarctica TaxID=1218801 RepID=A0A7L4ZJE3_9FLAO|nr:carboxypeptidase-like regulatory domain-containing protein [Kordia antarctica]QHI36631.1 TonB-dependent receptor SusC [Kordia antarctica]